MVSLDKNNNSNKIIQSADDKNNQKNLKDFIETMNTNLGNRLDKDSLDLDQSKNKEIKELVDTHKMLLELSELNLEDTELEKEKEESSNNQLEKNKNSIKSNNSIENEHLSNNEVDEFEIGDLHSTYFPYSSDNTIKNEDINLDFFLDSDNNKNKITSPQDESKEFQIIKSQLEKELGNDLFKFAYEITNKFSLKNKIQIDLDNIVKIIQDENKIEKKFRKEEIELVIEKIEVIWSMLILERK